MNDKSKADLVKQMQQRQQMQQPQQPQHPQQPQQPQLSAEMVKNGKTLTCNCGGIIFQNGLVLKKISAILSPTGQEIDVPIQVLHCKDCGLVPPETDPDGVLPEKIKSKPKFSLNNIN